MSIYTYIDYRKFLVDEFKSRKNFNSKISFTKLADTLRVQKTLVSKVLKGEANFNSDQLFQAAEFLGLSEPESDYLLLLLELDRCYVASRKAVLKERIREIQRREKVPSKNLQAEVLETPDATLQRYFLDPVAQLVHAFLMIDKFAARPELVRVKLGLDKAIFEGILDLLESASFVKRMPEGPVRLLKRQFHLSPESPVYKAYQHLMRMKGLDRLMQLPLDKRFCFSVLVSTDEESHNRLKELLLQFLKDAEKIVTNSDPSTVYQMNIDLFGWE